MKNSRTKEKNRNHNHNTNVLQMSVIKTEKSSVKYQIILDRKETRRETNIKKNITQLL